MNEGNAESGDFRWVDFSKQISLRDYFAGQVLIGLMDSATDIKRCTIIAYIVADEMLKAREL